jgi:hypothetical protein
MSRTKWRILIILILAVSCLLLTYAIILDWNPWRLFHTPKPLFERPPERSPSVIHASPYISLFGSLFTILFGGTILLYLFPEQINCMSSALISDRKRLLNFTLLGTALTVALSIAIISSALTMGTLPFGLFISTIFFISVFFGEVSFAFIFGRSLLERAEWGNRSPLLAYLFGQFVIYSMIVVPVIGIIILVLIIIIGLGVVVATHYGSNRSWTLSPLNS